MWLTRRLTIADDERVVAIIRRALLAYLGLAVVAACSLFLAFFLIVPLLQQRGRFGVLVFTALVVLGSVLAARAMWFWYWNALVVTDRRVIDVDQRGFFHRATSEARFEKIEDIALEVRGFLATVLHLGTIRIQTAGAQVTIELRTVSKPEFVRELLGRLQASSPSMRTAAAPPTGNAVDLATLSADALTRMRERIDVELRLRKEREQHV